MSGSLSHAANADPNLTPILDMVFQLITFFMLVINFKANEMDQQMLLPVVGSARPSDKGNQQLLMLNINKKGDFTVFGRAYTDDQMKAFIENRALADRLTERRKQSDFADDADLPTLVIVRADQNTPFKRLNDVLTLCQKNGYREFALRTQGKKPPS